MVHLAQIPSDQQKNAPPVAGMRRFSLDNFSTSVYGSRFAAQDLPRHEMPEKEMPKDVAYRMIKDDLSLDGNPMLK